MSETGGQRIRVILRWVQILDNLEPFFKEKGEFRFHAVVSSENRGGIRQETDLPEDGYWAISDHPAWNKEIVNRVIFEGEVDDHLDIQITGVELDKTTPDDVLDTYHREFRGPVDQWLGMYGPGSDLPDDEASPEAGKGSDPEMMSNWRLCLVIEKA